MNRIQKFLALEGLIYIVCFFFADSLKWQIFFATGYIGVELTLIRYELKK